VKAGRQISVLGAKGMLGTDLMASCRDQKLNAQGYDLPEFNITDAQSLKKIIDASSCIVNCAAYTNVDRAEQEEPLAMQVNGSAVGVLSRLAAAADVPVIHISTDFVFDGMSDRPYRETDKPNPINAYGRSKLEGEKQLAAGKCRYCLLRVEWTYGRAGVNFAKKILEAAQTHPVLKVVDDQVGSPTATKEVAAVICQILKRKEFPEGIYHLAADGYTSRYEMARFLCRIKGIQTPIEPCKTADFPSPAKRPLNSRFDCHKLQSLLGKKMKPWQESLTEFLEQI
jgi:dTDP-4-dehydrorhamnose reductase